MHMAKVNSNKAANVIFSGADLSTLKMPKGQKFKAALSNCSVKLVMKSPDTK